MSPRALLVLLLAVVLAAADASGGAGLRERLGARLPDALPLIASDGSRTTLGVVRGGRPLLLVPAYYGCPMLCGLVGDGLVRGLDDLGWRPGGRFAVATVSFDPRDIPAEAAAHEARTRAALRGPLAGAPWPFLIVDAAAGQALLDAIGMTVVRDDATGQFAHPAVTVVATADGRIARYLPGIAFPALDLRLALTEAGEGTIGSPLDRLLLYCYHYDPAAHRYGFAVQWGLRLASLAILATTVVVLAVMARRRMARVRVRTAP